MKNVIKMIFAVLIAAALFAGCSDFTDNSTGSKSQACIVSGRISIALPTGALPDRATGAVVFDGASRTAISSLEFDDSKTELKLTATNGEVSVEGTVDSENVFSILLPETGEWQISACILLDSKKLLEGSSTVVVDENYSAIKGKSVELHPFFYEDLSGSISLEVLKTEEDTKITNVKVLESVLDIEPAVFKDGKAVISAQDVPAGSYEVLLSFEDDTGNRIWSCNETFTVFSGFTTDSWYGASSHFIENEGKYSFSLDQDMIDAFDADIVPETKTVVFNKGSDSYSYYLLENVDESEVSNSGNHETNSFAFDNDGNFYSLEGVTTVNSTNKSFGTDGKIEWDAGTLSINKIAVDRKTGILYGLNSTEQRIYKLPLSGENPLESIAFENADGNWLGSCGGLSVYDNTAYVATYYNEGGDKIVYLYIVKLDTTRTASKIELFNGNDKTLNPAGQFHDNADVSDILYQDDAVYVLFRDCTFEGNTDSVGSSVYGRGCVIKYDLITKKIGTLGWTGEGRTPNDKFIYAQNVYEEDGSRVLKSKTTDTAFFTPDCTKENYLSQKSFYAPRKFIALKPKKLVIADDGYAFYTDSLSGYRYKNVNRIVTVDLETFAIENSEETKATFCTECSSEFLSGSGFTGGANYFDHKSTSYYTEIDEEGKPKGSSYSWVTAGYLSLGFLKDEE